MSARVEDGARYLRQRLLTEVGDAGQERLCATPVQLVGGSPEARAHARDYLARAGVPVVPNGAPDAARRVALPEAVRHAPALQPAADLLVGALAAVEAVKGTLGLGQPATVPPDLLLLGDD